MNSWFHSWAQRRRLRKIIRQWEKAGRPIPPPHALKQETILEYATRFEVPVFVETGTYLGEMIEAMQDQFQQLYSIELGLDLWKKARDRFADHKHISLLHGDSSAVLGHILAKVKDRCLFWLDGHYSEGITAKGTLNTPIRRELEIILAHPVSDHVVLIDDARCFVGRDDYPTIPDLQAMVTAVRPNLVMEVRDDIIRFHPPLRR